MISFLKLMCLCHIIFLLMTCVFNFIVTTIALCLMDGNCLKSSEIFIQSIYPKVVAFTCFVSLSTLLYKHRKAVAVYNQNVEACRSYSLRRGIGKPDLHNRELFNFCVTIACLTLTLFTHILRLTILYQQDRALVVLAFFLFMYVENFGMFLTEAYFLKLSFQLEKEFFYVNRDLMELGEEFAAIDPITTTTVVVGNVFNSEVRHLPDHRTVMYDGDFYRSHRNREQSSPVANIVEIIRIRHQLIRDAFFALSDLYSTPMGISLLTLCIMLLFDIYYQVYNIMDAQSRPLIFIYLWLLQYSIRFYLITMSAHNITAEVNYHILKTRPEVLWV